MSRTPAKVTQADVARASVVYIVRIGKHIKIGFSRRLEGRLKDFATSAVDIELLCAIPGGRDLEGRLHNLLAELRINRELFHRDWRITQFIHFVERDGLLRGIEFLEDTTPGARARKKDEDRGRRIMESRRSKAEKDAYFAALVKQRKERLGW